MCKLREKEMTLLVELTDLTQCFGSKTVLENVTLHIQEGEILALLGPNGSGKTTLLRVLAFLLKPYSGQIKFQGEFVNDKNSEGMRLQCAMVFQKTLLFNTSVFSNVAYGLRMRKISREVIDEEVTRALKMVRLEGFERRSAKKLSGGEQQRVALARALVLKTKLLLLDEPTANLDPKNASIIEDVILAANRDQRTTIVMATHNMFQARAIPQRVALINQGKITEVGTAAEIFSRLSRNLAAFAAVDNTFTGMARISDAGTFIVDIGNDIQIESTFGTEGEIAFFISPNDIIISRTRMESSARNVFKGRITQILDSGASVRLTIDVGKPFIAQITKASYSEMGLSFGAEVFITFKASSVEPI
jgi:tungstate transport system ATP-binding protein